MSDRFRVATYNIRKCVGLDRQRKPGRVLDIVSDLEADIVALQEADRRLGPRPSALPRRMIDIHSDMEPVTLAANDVSLGWHGNALLVRKGTRVRHAERLNLPHLEPRGAVLAELEIRGRALRVIGAHLALVRRFRQAQAATLADTLGARPAMPTVILGDFNEWSVLGALAPLAAGYDWHAPGRSFHAAQPMAALDRIATGPEITLWDAGVEEGAAARQASDHLPVWADLRWHGAD
ncbi:endonuclease/exonuclease/phosphatase family protein [Rhodovulum sp. YNF3179]|uniref:endonuclease/exonuclease/phosphatase family protein n=1 Tax=Rhodovulum sp. YNF3179 TaxID=3425127 RepID=UPI003D34A27C